MISRLNCRKLGLVKSKRKLNNSGDNGNTRKRRKGTYTACEVSSIDR